MLNNLENKIKNAINESIDVKKSLLETCSRQIEQIGIKLSEIIKNGGKIMFCGNGGSAADSQHLAAELVIRLRSKYNRASIAGLALTVDSSILTACGNDYGFDDIFSRQVEGMGRNGDALIGITTSGKSENIFRAINQAKKQNIYTIGLLGCDGGKIKEICDNSVIVPSQVTARIQESHILIGHIWCEMIEEAMFPELFI